MTNSQTSQPPVEGLVAQIINARELAINIGSEGGVKLKMKFAVLASEPIQIRDPVTNELLDTVAREKVRVEAVDVRAKVTICRTYRTTYYPGGLFYESGLSALSRPPRTEVETLEADAASYPPPLSEAESYVKIGDKVVEVKE